MSKATKKPSKKKDDNIEAALERISKVKDKDILRQCEYFFECRDKKKIVQKFNSNKEIYEYNHHYYCQCSNKVELGYIVCKKHLLADKCPNRTDMRLLESLELNMDKIDISVFDKIIVNDFLKSRCESILSVLNKSEKPSEKQSEKTSEKQSEKTSEKQSEKELEKDFEKELEKDFEKELEKDFEKELEKVSGKQSENVFEKELEKEIEETDETDFEEESDDDYIEDEYICDELVTLSGETILVNEMNEIIVLDEDGIGEVVGKLERTDNKKEIKVYKKGLSYKFNLIM